MKSHPDETMIYGLFDTRDELEAAFKLLIDGGIPVDDISLLMTEDTHDRDFKILDKNKVAQGAAAGSLMGGAVGGMLGGLLVLGVAGPIGAMIVGPMIALAAAGGLLGGLLGFGIPKDEAQRLHAALQEGKALMAVHLRDRDPAKLERARRLFAEFGGETLEIGPKPRVEARA